MCIHLLNEETETDCMAFVFVLWQTFKSRDLSLSKSLLNHFNWSHRSTSLFPGSAILYNFLSKTLKRRAQFTHFVKMDVYKFEFCKQTEWFLVLKFSVCLGDEEIEICLRLDCFSIYNIDLSFRTQMEKQHAFPVQSVVLYSISGNE